MFPPAGLAGPLSPLGQLSLGEDELLFTLGPGGEAMGMVGGRPASMVSFTSEVCPASGRGAGPLPVSIIRSLGGAPTHLEHYGGPAVSAPRAGVTEVVAMAEVSRF